MADVIADGARLEYERIEGTDPSTPTIVMLHEGLGSVALWRDFPLQLASATGAPVLVYSRRGYGRSEPLRTPRVPEYMHHEGLKVLPELLDRLGIDRPILLGHSDGASIALIHAGGSGREVAGIIAMAPHVFVEELSISSIAAARQANGDTLLRERLARYHDDVDGAFWGWNDVWLSPAFRYWNIEHCLPKISCPVLAIQGLEDEYGTLEQIRRISSAVVHSDVLQLPNCRHSPHRDQPAAVSECITAWLSKMRCVA